MTRDEFINGIIDHEGLEENQTPFRITDKKMAKWTSMFDDTIKLKLDPNAKKSKGRENFLYVPKGESVSKGVGEQFDRYVRNKPGISVSDAVKIFDQTGANGKLAYLKKKGIDVNAKLSSVLNSKDVDAAAKEVIRQVR